MRRPETGGLKYEQFGLNGLQGGIICKLQIFHTLVLRE